MPRPHDRPAGPNPDIRNIRVETLSDNWYVLRRVVFEQRRPDGTWSRETREAYDRGNGVAALLHDAARDTVLLVRQYRAPAHLNDHPDGILIEAPAGLIDEGEDPIEAVRRELREEVGHDPTDLRYVARLYMSPGSVTEHLTLFVGRYSPTTRTGHGGGDEHEDLKVIEVGLDEARAMVDDGEIVDAKTVLLIGALDRRCARPL